MPAVRELFEQSQLQLQLVAGSSGLGRELEWAHSCDLIDPWNWVSERQALLTNGSSIPADAAGQVAWIEQLDQAGIAAVGIGDEMNAPEFSREFIESCDARGLPCFLIPYPLSFSAVAQAVAESASLAQARRLRAMARLYELTTQDFGERQIIEATEQLVGHDIAVVDSLCAHSWIDGSPPPHWLSSRSIAGARLSGSQVPRVHEGTGGEKLQVVPLASMPGAHAWFRPRPGNVADQHLLLHAAAVLGATLSRRALDELQVNRRQVEYLDRILLEQERFSGGSETWMKRLGFSGAARGVVLVGGTQEQRESTVRRMQRHGVQLTWTLQHERQLLVAQHAELRLAVEHALEGEVRAGLGSELEVGAIHQSLRESVWSLLSAAPEDPVAEFAAEGSWMGFHGPGEAEHFVQGVLGALLEPTPMRVELLLTLRTYLRLNRSLKRTSEELVVHRQTVVQRLHKIEDLIGDSLSSTSVIARTWVALELHDALLH